MPILWDELPDIDTAPLMMCWECRRRTLFDRDRDGMPICREHTQDEVEHAESL